jgi:hypothetical protein
MNWTTEHYINLGLFVLTLLLTGLAQVQDWDHVTSAITPVSVSGFGLGVLTFIKTMYTAKPRDPNVGTRRSDPMPTAPIVNVGGHQEPVPPVTPGRPVDPDAAKEKP